MDENTPTEEELALAIESAAECAIKDLFLKHPEHFYYISLITSGSASAPVLTAWSLESLDVIRKTAGENKAASVKWSYADSPYFNYGEHFFFDVKRLFLLRPNVNELFDKSCEDEVDLRMRAMESAIRNLDKKGTFGHDVERLSIVINAEFMPPDYSNILRALRLNPVQALVTWLSEAAEQ